MYGSSIYHTTCTLSSCYLVNDQKKKGNAKDNDVDSEEEEEEKGNAKGMRKVTPYKAKDLVPLVRRSIATNPTLSNKSMKDLLKPYGKVGENYSVFTESLLQNTRTLAKEEIFGDPKTNATYVFALKCEMEKNGHKVSLKMCDRKTTLENIYNVVWEEEKCCTDITKRLSKKEYCHKWCEDNADKMYLSLGDVSDNYTFIQEFFFSPSTATDTVPKLQRVFQADAAFTDFGKYTLFSFYGTTANGNMFPVALGLVFGNENKESWMSFCKFIANLHPSINALDVTIITDQCKGSIAAIGQYFPNAFQFHCSYHRAGNILLQCKGGRVKHSPHWLFKSLVNCGTTEQIDFIREKYKGHLTAHQLKYLNSIPDETQYPAVRCAMGENIFLYDHEASSGVESMNMANKPARDRAAVDVVNAMILLLGMERYELDCFPYYLRS